MTYDMLINLPDADRTALGQVALSGLMTVARLKGNPSSKTMAAIMAVRDHRIRVNIDLESLPSLQPQEVAQQLTAINNDPQWRERLLRGMTLVAMFDGDPSTEHLQLLQDMADAFGVDNAPVETYRRTMSERLLMLRLDIARRSFIKELFTVSFRQEGFRGAWASLKTILGKEDKETSSRYRKLIDYPEGSFGRAYADFILQNHFNFPGEVGGPPPPVMRHDCCHVLGGYGTTSGEEGGVIGFQAGFENLDPFNVLMFAMAEFELGIGVSPNIPGVRNQLDPERLFAGMEHGSHVNTNLLADVDPWDYFADPLEEVRQRFNVLPRGREAEYEK